MSKYKKLHNGLCCQSQNFFKMDMPCSSLVDETDPFFLDMAINIGISVLEGHGFTTSSTCDQMCQRHLSSVHGGQTH